MKVNRSGREEGSATVLVVACLLVASLLSSVWVQAGRAALARQRAETAADLAAIAAANSASPCVAAEAAAASNGARLESCLIDGVSGVEVSVRVSEPMAALSRAHAGPADQP